MGPNCLQRLSSDDKNTIIYLNIFNQSFTTLPEDFLLDSKGIDHMGLANLYKLQEKDLYYHAAFLSSEDTK